MRWTTERLGAAAAANPTRTEAAAVKASNRRFMGVSPVKVVRVKQRNCG
jgi:hypothetical protein